MSLLNRKRSQPVASDHRWWALVLLAMADFVVILDASIALELRPRVARAWAEQTELDALPDGGTRLTYTVAIDSPILRLIPRFLTRPMAGLSRRALGGIVTVLPSPEAPGGAERG